MHLALFLCSLHTLMIKMQSDYPDLTTEGKTALPAPDNAGVHQG